MTVTLDDPKAYTRPWVALDKLQFVQIPPNVDLHRSEGIARAAVAYRDVKMRMCCHGRSSFTVVSANPSASTSIRACATVILCAG